MERGKQRWLPLLPLNAGISQYSSGNHTPQIEEPFAPPNTERPSGASSMRHSAPHSPPSEPADAELGDEEDEEDQPIELKVKATFSRPPSTRTPSPAIDYLSLPAQETRSTPSSPGGKRHAKMISRQLSNLAAEETHFKSHRDSVELMIDHKQDEEKINHALMNAHDSVILARSKFATRYPKSGPEPKAGWSRLRDLSPIPDASPPNASKESGWKSVAKSTDKQAHREKRATGDGHRQAHPDEHVGCPTCEVDRPRSFESKGKQGVYT